MNDISFLKNSLLYQMSLGSKELYHSNIWAWLIEQDSRYIHAFFPDFAFSEYTVRCVSREYHHRDIIVWLQRSCCEQENGYLVIENKIKTLPTVEQLRAYTEDLQHSKLLGAAFTGIINPLRAVEPVENGEVSIDWHFVDYLSIAEQLEQITISSDKHAIQEHSDQILEYCTIIRKICSILRAALEQKSGRLDCDFAGHDLDEIRIADIAVKMKAADFMRFVKENIEKTIPECMQKWIWFGQSFHNKKATLDFRLTRKIDQKAWLSLGIQIEGKQYRLIAERNASEYSCEQVYNEFTNDWFNAQEKSPSMRSAFCKYSGEYSFVYQYSDITEQNNSYVQLLEKILIDLRRAYEILLSKCT